MSEAELPFTISASESAAEATASKWDRFESLLGRLSERLNPILVKEARQALRSRQFTITFLLMLAAGWLWSIFGLALAGPSIYYSSSGAWMFFGYYTILAVPLIIGAPFSAYYSLSQERFDRTFELVSITSLGARQIVSGKLGSVALQIIVYLSAIFPCLAFTYLLRGLDIFTILLSVFYTCLASLGLAVAGLLLAALAPLRQRQMIMGLLYALLLCFALFVIMMMVVNGVLFEISRVNTWEAWAGHLALLTAYANCFALTFLMARSQLLGISQNRSSAVRIALVVTQVSFVGWMSWLMLLEASYEIAYVFLLLSSMFWSAAAVFITTESDAISPRVKRELPKSAFGRVFLILLAPGPSTGYLFVIANMLAAGVMALFFGFILPAWYLGANVATIGGARRGNPEEFVKTVLIIVGYLAFYFGLGKLLVSAIRRVAEVTLPMRALVMFLLVMAGAGVPFVLQMTVPAWRTNHYTLWQITNSLWTVTSLCGNGLQFHVDILSILVPAAGLLMFAANLPSILRDLRQVRIAPPKRVIEEDQELAAQAAGPPQPSSPWDVAE